jgi:hypothetical protein
VLLSKAMLKARKKGDQVNQEKAQQYVANLLDRLKPVDGGYELPGGIITAKERAAMAALSADAEEPDFVESGSGAAKSPSIVTRVALSDDCLGSPRDESGLLCVDFGTAFSKAAVWRDGEDAPIPIDLGGSLGGGLTTDSAAYISEGHLFFGPVATQRHAEEGDTNRALFDSPKEKLTHDHARFQADKPSIEVDPTGLFRTRDLLALYLGYLTSLTGDRLQALGVGRHIPRRFAAPGWGDAQISKTSPHFEAVSAQLKHLLIDAQILADTLPAAAWSEGLDVGIARAALDELAQVSSDRREGATFVERAVLEAVAAATGVHDQLVNSRPQMLVVDVGAGTTDIGAFKYNINEEGAKVSAYRDGLRAIRTAGNRLDDALIELAWSKLGLAADSQLQLTHARKMRPAVRDLKRDIFESGTIQVDVDGFDTVAIDQDEFCKTKVVAYFARTFGEQVRSALNGAGIGSRNFLQTNQPNIAVFTGGGGSLPFLRDLFAQPIELDEGKAIFEVRDPVPAWVGSYTADVAEVFPQLAVSTGGCSPFLPDEKSSVMDTTVAGARTLQPIYR